MGQRENSAPPCPFYAGNPRETEKAEWKRKKSGWGYARRGRMLPLPHPMLLSVHSIRVQLTLLRKEPVAHLLHSPIHPICSHHDLLVSKDPPDDKHLL